MFHLRIFWFILFDSVISKRLEFIQEKCQLPGCMCYWQLYIITQKHSNTHTLFSFCEKMTFISLTSPLMFPPTYTPPISSFSGFRDSSDFEFLNGHHSHVPPTHNGWWCHGQNWPKTTHMEPSDPLCLANGINRIQAKDAGFQPLWLCWVSWVYDFINVV